METREIERRILQALPASRAEVTGTDAHYSAVVVSGAFEGKTRIEQHQMIYALFREEMANQAIHALALKTCTPAEWERETNQEKR
jgi:acid stress-induced BolA-like protein IbaG/YrbA